MTSKCYLYEWRSHNVEFDYKTWCRQWGKFWVFQLERGEETGKLHFQGMISLKTKRTKAECINVMPNLPEHFAPICNNSVKGGSESFYCTKPDTRVDGPWSDKDEEVYIPKQFRNLKLWPWQQKIWDSCDNWEPRQINVLCDPAGCNGKSTIAELCELYGRGYSLPPMNDQWELIRTVADELLAKQDRHPKAMFFDITRSSKQDKLFGMYAAIEQLKTGKVRDTRYHSRKWYFDSPVIWVFCNEEPHEGYLTKGRWIKWRFIGEGDNLDIERC